MIYRLKNPKYSQGEDIMKKRLWMILGGLTLTLLTACAKKGTPAEENWTAAKKSSDTAAYVTEHRDELEALKAEAQSAESLSQQFKAVALLCMAEYQDQLSASDSPLISGYVNHDVFLFDYPETSAYVDSYFSKVNTDNDAFWESLSDAYYPYDYFLPMFAASKNLDGQTLSNLMNNMPSDGSYATYMKDAIDDWIENRPGKLAAIGDTLMEMNYFDGWNVYDWTGTFLHKSTDPYLVKTDTADDGLAYVRYMRDTLIPGMENNYGRDTFLKASDLTGGEYYSTDLAVTIGEDLQLSQPQEDGLPETIDLDGKKVAAFYYNPTAGEDIDAPPSWRILGDFMMGLPDSEIPATLSEADYYLVLTSDHQFGNYYQDQSGNSTKIQAVYSSSSLDLYDAATGAFLRHVGNVMENPSNTIFKDIGSESCQYPELVPADVLSYIYHNINEPDTYRTLLDNTSNMEEPLLAGGTGLIGPWEITLNSFEIVKSFEDGIFSYSASDGCQFLRGRFTVSNRGYKTETFLSANLHLSADNALFAGVLDGSGENYYPAVDAMTYSDCLNGKSLEPGETKEGVILFEVGDEALGGTEPLYISFELGYQMLLYSTAQ